MSDSSPARVITRLLPALVVGCALAAVLPSAALASSPGASTDDVTVTGAATATVDGSVNPGGETTTYDVGYDLASSDWCTSGGASGSPANATAAQKLGFTDTDVHDVSVDLTGLTPGTQYCASVVASNSSGSATGGPFQFGAGLPLASTFDANATGASTATVDGSVNPSGQTTTYKVEYDVADSDWCQTGGGSGSPGNSSAAQTLGFTDSAPHDVTVGVSGLSPGTDYCADLVASNSSGDADGGQAFLEAALPNVFTEDTFATGATTAKVDAIVNGIGQPTSYAVQYDLASSQWCQTGGASGAAAHSTPSQQLGFTDSDDHEVSVVVTGLNAATDYCADLVATNTSGSEDGGQLDFTTLTAKPSVATGLATDVGPMNATLTGTVNPSGLTTTWHFEYGTTENYGSSTPSAGGVRHAGPDSGFDVQAGAGAGLADLLHVGETEHVDVGHRETAVGNRAGDARNRQGLVGHVQLEEAILAGVVRSPDRIEPVPLPRALKRSQRSQLVRRGGGEDLRSRCLGSRQASERKISIGLRAYSHSFLQTLWFKGDDLPRLRRRSTLRPKPPSLYSAA